MTEEQMEQLSKYGRVNLHDEPKLGVVYADLMNMGIDPFEVKLHATYEGIIILVNEGHHQKERSVWRSSIDDSPLVSG